MTRILIVEDEESFSDPLSYSLRKEGYEVAVADTGTDGLRIFTAHGADLVLLDLMLPGMSGTEVCREIRRTSTVPVIMLTAKDDEFDKVLGLELGADDYVTKPFETAEVLFRLRALVRRSHGHAHPVLRIGELTFDTHSGSVTLAGRPISLTAQESRLLAYLAHAAPRVVSRGELAEHVYDRDHEPDSNVIDVQISRLRRKLGAPRIETLRGQGYRLVDAAPAP